MSRPPATATVQLETDDVRVTRWDFPPGTETGHHRHGYDYIVVPITSGTLTAETVDGEQAAPIEAGVGYNRSAGVEHNIVNRGLTVVSLRRDRTPGPARLIPADRLWRPRGRTTSLRG